MSTRTRQRLQWPNRCPRQSRCITRRVLDISSPPTQPFSSGHNSPPTRHWRTNPCLLPHCPFTSVHCWWSPHPPNCGSNTANYGSSHFWPLNSSYFHLRPSHFLRAPHAPLNQAHAASERRCAHVCPWAPHYAKARSPSRPKGDDADTRQRCTMHRTPQCQGHLWNTQASSILAWACSKT